MSRPRAPAGTPSRVPPPQPRDGVLGHWDRLIGPGATRLELTLVLGGSVAGAALACGALILNDASAWRVALAAALAFDLVGGAIAFATRTTKQWHHRAGTGAGRLLGFTTLHTVHIAVVALVFRGDGFDLGYWLATSGSLIGSAGVVAAMPLEGKRPAAACATIVSLAVVLGAFGPTSGLEWFLPAMFVKLILGHAVPHAEQTRR